MALLPAIRQEFALSEEQAEFVAHVARGVGAKRSAELAGFAPDHGYSLVRSPRIQGAIEAEIRRILQTESAPLALKTAHDLLDKKVPAATRAMVAKLILDKAGYANADIRSGSETTNVDLADMTTEQLKAYLEQHTQNIERLEGELSTRAKPVDSTPDSAPNGADRTQEPSELLD